MRLPRHRTRTIAVVTAGIALGVALVGCSSGTPATSGAQPSTSSAAGGGSANPSATKFLDANGVDLKGVWVSTDRQYRGLTERGKGSERMTISEQDGAVFLVSRDLELDHPFELGNDGPATKTATGLRAVGVVNADGSITIVKEGDPGQLHARLTDPNTMVLSYTEAGDQPAVARVTLVRDPKASPPGSTPGGSTPSGSTPSGSTPGSTRPATASTTR